MSANVDLSDVVQCKTDIKPPIYYQILYSCIHPLGGGQHELKCPTNFFPVGGKIRRRGSDVSDRDIFIKQVNDRFTNDKSNYPNNTIHKHDRWGNNNTLGSENNLRGACSDYWSELGGLVCRTNPQTSWKSNENNYNNDANGACKLGYYYDTAKSYGTDKQCCSKQTCQQGFSLKSL